MRRLCCGLSCSVAVSAPDVSCTGGSSAAATAAAARIGHAAAPTADRLASSTPCPILCTHLSMLQICVGACWLGTACWLGSSSCLGLGAEAAAAVEAKHPVLLLPSVVVRVQSPLAAPVHGKGHA